MSTTRKRWCTDGSTIKNPKCCQGRESFCKKPENVPDVETKICPVMPYWSKWSEWSGCGGQKYEVRFVNNFRSPVLKKFRRRKCVAGQAGKSPGCDNEGPQRKDRRLCPKNPYARSGLVITEAPEPMMLNDVMSENRAEPTEIPEIEETTTDFATALGIKKPQKMLRAMKNKPKAPLPAQVTPFERNLLKRL